MSGLEDQVAELRAEIAALRAELAAEVRTQRLVVVDADGAEWLITEQRVDDLHRAFELRMQTPDGGAHVTMSTIVDVDGARATVGAGVVHGGDGSLFADNTPDGPLTAYVGIEEMQPRRMTTVSTAGIETSEDFVPSWELNAEGLRLHPRGPAHEWRHAVPRGRARGAPRGTEARQSSRAYCG